MKAALLPVLLGLAALGQCRATSVKAQVTPVQKVVQLLDGMVTKAKEEKHEEALQFAGFSQFCSDVTRQKTKDIEEADEEIELLEAHIQQADTEADRLAIEIQNHVTEIAQMESDKEAAVTVRHAEREEYLAMHQNYTESIHALSKAIMALKAQDYDRKGEAASLLQKVQSAVPLPQKQGRALAAFLAVISSEEPDLTFAPEGGAPSVPTTAYKFRSTDIVEMLEGLEVRFKDELHKLEADEVSRQQAHTMLLQDLKGSSDAASASQSRKSSAEAKNRQESAAGGAELKEVVAERTDDDKYLTDLNQTCVQKTKEFDAREKLRGEEISALEKAIEILTGQEVKGAAEKHLPAAITKVIKVRKQALVQLRGRDSPDEEVSRAANFLREASERLHSHQLAALAVQAGTDPFAKVKQLIEELIKRLMAEATGEAEHKGWCDTELSTNAHTRKTKTEEIDMLRSEIDGLTAGIAQLTKDIATLSTEISAIDAAVAEATDIRNNESATNNVTVTEARAAQKAVADAVKVLKDFYAKAAEATALVQGRAQRQDPEAAPGGSREAPPPIFDSPYQGQQSESGGVLGMLEVIASDFARLEQDTIAEEETATAEYNGFMEDSSISKAQKESGVTNKKDLKRQKEQTLSEKQDSLTSAESVLGTAEDEYDKLKPACIDTGMTYEERVQARKDEIEALKQALAILSGQDV